MEGVKCPGKDPLYREYRSPDPHPMALIKVFVQAIQSRQESLCEMLEYGMGNREGRLTTRAIMSRLVRVKE